MKRKLSVLVIIIVIVAMLIAVIAVLAAQRSFETEISSDLDDLYTPGEPIQIVGANQQLRMFDGRPFILYLREDILAVLQEGGAYYEFIACTKEEGVDDRESPIENGVVQIEKERGTGQQYLFRFKWDESTKILVSEGYIGVPVFTAEGTLTEIGFDGDFKFKVLLVDKHPKSGKDHCYWFTIWEDTLEFTVKLTEQP